MRIIIMLPHWLLATMWKLATVLARAIILAFSLAMLTTFTFATRFTCVEKVATITSDLKVTKLVFNCLAIRQNITVKYKECASPGTEYTIDLLSYTLQLLLL